MEDIAFKLKLLSAYTGVTRKQMADALGCTPQNLSLRIKRNTLKADELQKIADIVGATWVFGFRLSNGTML